LFNPKILFHHFWFRGMRRYTLQVSKGRYTLSGMVQEIGSDLLFAVWGGTRPHIGAVGIAIPRPSLKNAENWSATSSNFTFLGHKEDSVVKTIAERIAAQLRRNVVVTAGMHWERMDPAGIQSIEYLAIEIADRLIQKFPESKPKEDSRGFRASSPLRVKLPRQLSPKTRVHKGRK
jgi:hypothetical protein